MSSPRVLLRVLSIALLLGLALGSGQARAQQILIDRGARVDGLWVFPSALDPKHYYYIPNAAELVYGSDGSPSFSYMRYVVNQPKKDALGMNRGFTRAEGGGILHFLITYDTPPQRVLRAERALQALVDDDEVVIRGPVMFTEGRYALVSSIIRNDGSEATEVLATGNAPVLEGSQLAFSFEVDPERSTLLLESLQMVNPDVAIVFDMTFEGLTDAYDAKLRVHWDEVKNSQALKADAELFIPSKAIATAVGAVGGGAAGMGAGTAVTGSTGATVAAAAIPNIAISANLGAIFEELRQEKAIEIEVRGSDERMQAVFDSAYSKLLELMFRPWVPERAVQKSQGGMISKFLGGLTKAKDDKKKAEKKKEQSGDGDAEPGDSLDDPGAFGLTLGYELRRIERTGTTTLDLNHQSKVQRHASIVFGLGDVWSEYGADKRYFRTVNVSDPAFDQREVQLAIDGAILPEFESYINTVTTTLRKVHENGKHTLQEVIIDREVAVDPEKDLRLIYGWKGDSDRGAWLDYEYRTRWSFSGGGVYETGWVQANRPMIDLYAPYKRRRIHVVGDTEELVASGVRAAIVRVTYPFFEDVGRDEITIRPQRPPADASLEVTLPLDVYEYDYEITWLRGDGSRLVQRAKDSTGVIFIDELPEDPPVPVAEANRPESG